MSGFERALLEGKERDELSKIAEQLGKKPPARAKKADMIDLILTLAGVSPDDNGVVDDGSAPASTVPKAGPARVRSDGAASAAAGPDQGERDRDDRNGGKDEGPEDRAEPDGAEPDGAEPDGAPQQVEAGDRKRPQSGSQQSGSQQSGSQQSGSQQSGNQPRPSQPSGDRQNSNQQPGNQQPGNQQPGNQSSGNERVSNQPSGNERNGAGDPHDDSGTQAPDLQGDDEPGNRRRRRRGRGDRGQNQGQTDGFEGDPVDVEGLLDLRDDGYGFLRLTGYLPSKDDVYVSVKQVRQFGLRRGDRLAGKSRPAGRNEKNPALLQIDAVNGAAPDASRARPRFESLTPLFPDARLSLETNDAGNMTARIIDLISPIGKGQRGLIVSPPKAGKTTIMKQIARSIETNHPECELIVLLVDERPEEVTDMKRWLLDGEVAASTFDRPSDEHVQVAELVIERAKRLVEEGKDVVVILDGITRLARAYNLANPATGRIMSGGIDAGALYPPKRFFGAARNVEEGGSLTILATALVETNSKMDEHIFEEFKGTGNMELKLDRRLAERRIFPAIDVDASSTRHEELLFDRKQLQQVWKLRRVLGALKHDEGGGSNAPGLELLIDRMRSFKTNADFLAEIAKAAPGG